MEWRDWAFSLNKSHNLVDRNSSGDKKHSGDRNRSGSDTQYWAETENEAVSDQIQIYSDMKVVVKAGWQGLRQSVKC